MSSMKEGLHRRWLLAATGGFANRAVADFLKGIVSPTLPWRHWGDTDLAGIRIALPHPALRGPSDPGPIRPVANVCHRHTRPFSQEEKEIFSGGGAADAGFFW
jgi:hypothetical protein